MIACLPYLVPLLEVLKFGTFLFILIPPLKLVFSPLFPLLPIYYLQIGGVAVIEWTVFLGLFLGVVQNYKLTHFLRFNAMQALLLGIFAALCDAAMGLMGYSGQLIFAKFIGETNFISFLVTNSLLIVLAVIFSAIFIFVVGASVYSIVQTLRGQYAEIPLISEAAHSQVR